jgi:hypothetical protein
MTVSLNSGFSAAANAPAYGELALVECQAVSGTLRLTTWPMDVNVMGQTWIGVGALGSISQLHESDDGNSEKLTLSLSPIDLGLRAFALGDPADYQDRTVRIWVALLDANTLQIQGSPVLRFAGAMDQMKIERDGTTATISMDCQTACYDVRTNPAALRMNDAQHKALFPNERGFEYLQSLIGNPAVYSNKAFSAYMYLRGLMGFH